MCKVEKSAVALLDYAQSFFKSFWRFVDEKFEKYGKEKEEKVAEQ